jgi:hypothetical protein
MANENLTRAKNAKNDEFYTQYNDIQKEINAYLDFDPDVFRDKTILLPCDDPEWSNFTKFFAQNFEHFGLKKLISTSYAKVSKINKYGEIDLFADSEFITQDPQYKPDIDPAKGKIFTLTRRNKRVDINDLKWKYLNGDGDFRSDEIKALRDEADFIITNPPFSMFREFMSWLFEKDKKFLIIGNMNAVTYKEIFPLVKNNKMWYGVSITSGDRKFNVPDSYPLNASGCGIDENNRKYIQVKGVRWFTNLDHGRRHQPLQLMTMAENIKFNKKLKGQDYRTYDNYDAIEVPYTDAIPKDYDGMMGVPISFLDKYCPEQFEILGITQRNDDPYKIKKYTTDEYKNANDLNARATILVDGIPKSMYPRILIKHIKRKKQCKQN